MGEGVRERIVSEGVVEGGRWWEGWNVKGDREVGGAKGIESGGGRGVEADREVGGERDCRRG